MSNPLIKTRICPTCGVSYKAGETISNGKPGRTCPAGHHHSYYELQRHEHGKPIRVGIGGAQRGRKYVDVLMPGHKKQDQAELLAMLWLGTIDRLLDQLPDGSMAKAMIEGATAQAYRASQAVIDARAPDERKVA